MSELQQQVNTLLTWQRVRAWAKSQPEHAFVGKQSNAHACPLACYLNERSVGKWVVGATGISYENGKIASLPLWATRCVVEVDHTPLEESERGEIDRERFLAILDKCKPEEA